MVEDDGVNVCEESYLSIKKSGTDLLSLQAELYLYDARFDQFLRLHENVDVILSDLGGYAFGIFINKSGTTYYT